MTSADSAVLVMGNFTSRLRTPTTDAARWVRVYWAVATGVLTLAMLLTPRATACRRRCRNGRRSRRAASPARGGSGWHGRCTTRTNRPRPASGRRAKAFEFYQEVRDRLVEELGVDPGPELRAAHAALLNEDLPDVAPRAALPVPRQLPAEPPGFTGRIDKLSILDKLLPTTGEGGTGTVAAISGTAGVGKTTLAVHWAHRVRNVNPPRR